MRIHPLIPCIAVMLATPALAQTAASPSVTGTTAGFTSGAGTTPMTGRPPAPLGTTTTLGERIDNAAGLDSRRAIINGTAGSLGAQGNRVTGNSTSASGLENAGRPSGTPLGVSPATGTAPVGSAASPARPSPDPRYPG